ncbi:DUF2726 domain-containing protein [Lederbergia lenta]|uniref:Protein of uncharacterized function (DUF2726) n=2 Tax=Lederbergia lenta TaxID=1467 RepID=A0A2X4W9K0_LEDLE|nr:DUF2726 domain-containing protein [Lederbergia lenta]SQI59861.1 Protein of uncharacterised function (DUF2726) [Lederbergia lenta]
MHLIKRKTVSAAPFENYINFIQSLKKRWKNKFIKAYIIDCDKILKPYVWSTGNHITEQSEKTSPNHQKYLDFLEKNRKDIAFIGRYKAMRTKGMHLCTRGHEWFIQPIKVKNGETCPKCKRKSKESHGANLITDLLEEKKIQFVKEMCLDRLGSEKRLYLDFLVCKNHYPLFAIEFNGKQHYSPLRNEFFGGPKGFAERKKRDWIKRKTCWNIGLPVVDIPYTESKEQIQETMDYFLDLFEVNH